MAIEHPLFSSMIVPLKLKIFMRGDFPNSNVLDFRKLYPSIIPLFINYQSSYSINIPLLVTIINPFLVIYRTHYIHRFSRLWMVQPQLNTVKIRPFPPAPAAGQTLVWESPRNRKRHLRPFLNGPQRGSS